MRLDDRLIFTLTVLLFVACICMLLTGCSTAIQTIDVVCEEVSPIIISKDDVLTDETARQIYVQDIYLQNKCDLKKSNIGHD